MNKFSKDDSPSRSTSRNCSSSASSSFVEDPAAETTTKSPGSRKCTFNNLMDNSFSTSYNHDDLHGGVQEKSESSLRFDSKGVLPHASTADETDPEAREGGKAPAGENENTNISSFNDSFRDVERTGEWGKLSKKEVLFVVGVLSMIFVVLVVGLSVVAISRNKSDQNQSPANDNPSSAPVEPLVQTEEAKYSAIVGAMAEIKVLSSYANNKMPDTVAGFNMLEVENTPFSDPILRSISWILYEDGATVSKSMLVQRFALASIYFANAGVIWIDSTNWLSDISVCEWHGVTCYGETIRELDLSSNNLQGPIIDTVALLQDTFALLFNVNALSGPIPAETFGSMSSLKSLYLQKNSLTGIVSASLADNGVLETLYVHGNNLEGAWPEEFCYKTCPECPGLKEFGLNCEQTTCDEQCCSPLYNCF